MSDAIVSLNCGSSSIKFAAFVRAKGDVERAVGGSIENIGTAPVFVANGKDGEMLIRRALANGAALTHSNLLETFFEWLPSHLRGYRVVAVGHRVVHGGRDFIRPMIVDAVLLRALDALASLAPLHQPHNLAGIRAASNCMPDVTQVACFDTAFHRSMATVATRFALPRAWHDKGIQRYGFHGLSYEYVALTLRQTEPALAGGRVLVAHLGNGASLCAMRDGKSVDTTMGFTTLDGLMMGTRGGTIDPGVILHLQLREGMTVGEIEDMLYHHSGLRGVSGLSNDMRELHASADPRAAEAIDLFVWRAVREAGALIAAMGGIDALVFTAGIGENDALVRHAICERLGWAGVVIDDAANARHATAIDAPGSAVAVRVIPTDEERMIALHALGALAG